MSISVNPSLWASWNLRAKDKQFDAQMQLLMSQISQWAQQIQALVTNSAQLASVLNGSGSLAGSAFASKIVDLGTITTDQTVPVAGAQFVYVRLSSAVTQTRTLTLTALPQGALVQVYINDSVNALTFKMAATDTVGNAYGITSWTASSGATTNLVTAGFTFSAGIAIFLGSSGYAGTVASPQLNFILS